MWSVPNPCGICGTQAVPAITCSGRCGRSFHTVCVNVDPAWLNAVANNLGLHWFCAECDNMQIRQAYGVFEIPGFPTATSGVERGLPPEVWEQIFQSLDPQQMLHIRRTCRYWRRIVDGSRKILDRLTVCFPPFIEMDASYNPTHLLPAATASWNAAFWTRIINVDLWWPSFGPTLTCLKMGSSEISLATLLGIFRHTPNLRELSSGEIEYEAGDPTNVDFQLNKMERLTVLKNIPSGVIDVFGRIFPCLKSFEMDCLELEEAEEQSIYNFLNAVQESLQELDVMCDDELLDRICRLEHLKLKKMSLNSLTEDEDLLEICRLQPHLLDIHTSTIRINEVLCEIGRHCPKLRRFTVSINQDADTVLVPTFLNTMTELECLKIEEIGAIFNGTGYPTDFAGMRNEHITEISLSSIRPVGNSLQQYFLQSPKLTTVFLANCRFPSWPEVFATLRCIKLLQKLSMFRTEVDVQHAPIAPHEPSNHLKCLVLENCKISNEILDCLLSQYPMLQELILLNYGNLKITRELKMLKRLTLRGNKLSFSDMSLIVNNCRKLEKVTVSGSDLEGLAKTMISFMLGSRLRIIN